MEAFLFDSLKRYKEDQEIFTTWLVNAARECGAQPDILRKPDTQRRTKKAGKTQFIHVEAYIELATVLSSAPIRIEVPAEYLSILSNVIQLRKEHACWLEKLPSTDETSIDDKQHQYFVKVLEQTREILKPLVAQKEEPQMEDDTSLPDNNFTNRFEALAVEDPTLFADLKTAPSDRTIEDHRASKQKYDVERNEEDYEKFLIYCFLEDVAIIRRNIQQQWGDYLEGFPLTSVSVVTDVAIEIISRKFTDLVAQLPAASQEDPLFWIYSKLVPEQDLAICFSGQPELEIPSTYIPSTYFTGTLGLSLCLSTYIFFKRTVSQFNKDAYRIPRRAEWESAWFETDWSTLDTNEQLRQDEVFIKTILSYFHNLSVLKGTLQTSKDPASQPHPGFDNLTQAFCGEFKHQSEGRVSENKNPTPWTLFGLQILVDINHILGANSYCGFIELRSTADSAMGTISQFRQSMETSTHIKESLREKFDTEALQIDNLVNGWIIRDRIGGAVEECLAYSGLPDVPEIPNNFLFRKHPLLCGTLSYWLLRSLQKLGIEVCNAYNACKPMAHLFNACKQSGMNVSWPDMDYVISKHPLFVGEPPTNPEEFYRRFMLASGASATGFTPSSRREAEIRKGAAQKRELRTSYPIFDILDERYLTGLSGAKLSNAHINAILSEESMKPLNDLPLKADDKCALAIYQWKMGIRNETLMLGLMTASMILHEKDLHFNYLRFNLVAHWVIPRARSDLILQAKKHSDADARHVSEELPENDYATITKRILMGSAPEKSFSGSGRKKSAVPNNLDAAAYKRLGFSLESVSKALRSFSPPEYLEMCLLAEAEARKFWIGSGAPPGSMY